MRRMRAPGRTGVERAFLVGCGAMSRTWLEAARQIEGIAIVGLADIDRSRAEQRAREFHLDGAAIGTSLSELLAVTKPDVVFDVVVPEARTGLVIEALRAGCHVLSEKPLATGLVQAREMLAAAKAANRIHAVVQNRRYIAPVRRLRRLMDNGAIGHPTSIHCDFFLGPHFGGFREEMRHVLLLDMAIHTFDAARAITGLEAERVYCREWDPPTSWYTQGSSAAAFFDMSGGAIFTYRGSWAAEGLRTSWESAWRIVGERGSAVWDGFETMTAEVVADSARDGLFSSVVPVTIPSLGPGDRVGGHLGVMGDFIDAVRTGARPETVATDNLKSLAMVLAAIKGAETGLPVPIES